MNCPSCSKALTVRTVSGLSLDVCETGCAGIWFDQFEFKKFDESNEPDIEGTLRLTVKSRPQSANAQLNCPKCSNIKMMRYFSSVKRKVTIDECPSCAGVWLDAGELTAIRQEFSTEEARDNAAEEVYSEMFGDQMLAEREKSFKKAEKAENFARLFRLVTPSYYRPIKK